MTSAPDQEHVVNELAFTRIINASRENIFPLLDRAGITEAVVLSKALGRFPRRDGCTNRRRILYRHERTQWRSCAKSRGLS